MSTDMLKQLGEIPSNRMTDKQKMDMIEGMLLQAEQKHFEATINGAWNPVKLKEAENIKGMMDTMEKQLAVVKSRIPVAKEDVA